MSHELVERDVLLRNAARPPELRAPRPDRTGDQSRIANLLTPAQQAQLMGIATHVTFRHGEDIITEGAEGNFAYTVASGIVRKSRCAESGRRQVMAFELPGDLFGIPAQGRYLNSARAIGDVSLFQIPWHELNALLLREPGLHSSFLVRMAFDLHRAQGRILVLGQQNVSQRLASFLLELMEHEDFYDAARKQLRLPLSRFDLGDYLGTSPETVVRVLARLEKDGLIQRLSSRLLHIADAEGISGLLRDPRRKD